MISKKFVEGSMLFTTVYEFGSGSGAKEDVVWHELLVSVPIVHHHSVLQSGFVCLLVLR